VRETRDYDDIPGTYIFDGEHSRAGYHLNMFCMSLNEVVNRQAFADNQSTYLDRYPMTVEQKTAVLDRDWLAMLRLGGNIYYTFKIAVFDQLSMQHVAALMSGNAAMTVDDFRQMMLAGGRPIDGNRSKKEQQHG